MIKLSKMLLTFNCLFMTLLANANTDTQKWSAELDKGSGSVEFRATGRPSALHITGKGAAPHGSLTLEGKHVTGTASFLLSSLDTGIAMRTEHMKEKYLEIGKFPEAKLTIVQMDLPNELTQEKTSMEHIPFTGKLMLHGVEKPVSGVAKVEKSGNIVNVVADFGLKIGEFAITTPTFAGITMADNVDVSVQSSAPLVLKLNNSKTSVR